MSESGSHARISVDAIDGHSALLSKARGLLVPPGQ